MATLSISNYPVNWNFPVAFIENRSFLNICGDLCINKLTLTKSCQLWHPSYPMILLFIWRCWTALRTWVSESYRTISYLKDTAPDPTCTPQPMKRPSPSVFWLYKGCFTHTHPWTPEGSPVNVLWLQIPHDGGCHISDSYTGASHATPNTLSRMSRSKVPQDGIMRHQATRKGEQRQKQSLNGHDKQRV